MPRLRASSSSWTAVVLTLGTLLGATLAESAACGGSVPAPGTSAVGASAVAPVPVPLGTGRSVFRTGLEAPAALVPSDVTLFVQLDEAAQLRRLPAGRSMVGAVERSLAAGPIGAAWARLAQGVGVDPSALFDRVCGRRCVLATRRSSGDEPGTRTWVLLTELRRSELERVVQPLRPRRLAPRHDLPVVELPEHALLVACSGSVAVFGPSSHPELFEETLALLAGGAAIQPLSLAPSARRSARLFPDTVPAITVLARHEPPLGGWSALAATTDEEKVVVRHAAEFAQSPFTRPVPVRAWQPAALASLEQGALATIVEPAEIGLPAQDFVESITGEPVLDHDARRELGLRQVLVLGEAEGRLEKDPIDLMVPTFAIAIEVDPSVDPREADAVLDRNVVRLSKALVRLGQGTFDLALPSLRHHGHEQERLRERAITRRIDLEPAAAWLAPGFPALRGVSLNWQRVDGPHGRYWVIASHPQQLGATVAALERAVPAPAVEERAWASCGSLNGRRVALHLRSWADNARAIAPEAPAAAIEDFRATAELFAALSDGMRRCRWTLARPTANSMELEVTLELPAPTSGR